MSKYKLVLVVGDTVRNIRPHSSLNGFVGTVVASCHKIGVGDTWVIKYQDGRVANYVKEQAHFNLKKLVSECPCSRGTPREIIEVEASHRYLGFGRHYQRRVLEKVRRNVITGRTQEDHVKQNGYARGVAEFNTRALGTSTGQALRCIGDAMCNPNQEIRITGVDHYLHQQTCDVKGVLRANTDKHFRGLVTSLLGNMKGFTMTDTHIVFNPIVTEETYVELK